MSDKADSEHIMSLRSEPDGAPNQNNVSLLSFTMTSSPTNGHRSASPNKSLNTSKESSFSSDKSASPVMPRNKQDSNLPEPRQGSSSPINPRNNGGNGNGNSMAQSQPNFGGNGCQYIGGGPIDAKVRPGEFVMRILFAEFTSLAEKKIEIVMMEPPERTLSKSLQRGEDAAFDQLLLALGSVSEHCLPSILRTLFAWYDRQAVTWLGNPLASGSLSSSTGSSLTSSIEYIEKEQLSLDPVVIERRDMAVEFIFCLVLIEVLKQLAFHPGHHDLVGKIEDLAFAHFKYREGTGVHAASGLVIADLYAEVLGVLAQARFGSVRVRFLSELAELRGKEATGPITQSIVSLLMGMKFFRIKMAPIEDFEASFQFLTECAKYFLEVKQRDIKHALAGLFVEILVPVAATVKHEVNVPCLKSFVEMLYTATLDLCTRSKHRLALFPLVTCLLCVSQRPFFLHNWHYFLAMCLSQLKSREPKMSRVALESLYRLLWAYMIRIKCESNSATQSRLLSIVNSLFPKGSKGVVPRDTPLNIFVKIIQFIAQERLDFAMREIVFELLSVGRPIKIILAPERMNIGLRAFLVAADSLQQKDGDPPMPRSAGVMPSGNTLLRVKKTFLNKVLTEDTAKSIGMASYYPLIRKVFADILRALDLQCGRPLLSTAVKEQEESLLTGDRKAKIDLFRTCVAAIPRLIPDGMSRNELLSLLSRLTLHIDEELRGLAYQSLQSLLIDYPDWRNDVLAEFITFASKEVPDTAPQQLDNALRMLLQLLTSWRGALTSSNWSSNQNQKGGMDKSTNGDENERITVTAASTVTSAVRVAPTETKNTSKSAQFPGSSSSGSSSFPNPNTVPLIVAPNLQTFHQAEGLALLMLCSVRASSRRLGAHMLKEIKGLSEYFGLSETPVLDVLDKLCPTACEKLLNILPASEKQAVVGAIASNSLDLQWLTERSCPAWYTQQDEDQPPSSHSSTSTLASSLNILQSSVVPPVISTDVWGINDPWLACLKEFLKYENVPTKCPRTVLEAWPFLMSKITALFTYLEPNPVTDNRASLLRSSTTPRKPPTDRNLYFKLWRNYVLFGFRTVPPNAGSSLRCISPDVGISSSPEAPDGREGRSPLPLHSLIHYSFTPTALYKIVLPLMRSEAVDVRDLAVHSVGNTNHIALKDLFDDLAPYLREACDRKQENVRRRKRKDNLRLQILKILKMMAKEKIFSRMASMMSHSSVASMQAHHHLHEAALMLPVPFLEFLDSCKGWLETETDREGGLEMRINFCKTVHYLLRSLEVDLRENVLKKEVRKTLFHLCIGWAGPYSQSWGKDLNTSGSSSSSSGSSPRVAASLGGSTKLEFSALQAAASLLTGGPVFQASLLSEESTLYSWIDFLLSSSDAEASSLGENVVITLLEYNPDAGSILDWVVSRCFTGSAQIADACFRAISILFSTKEYPCDRYVAIINTALLYSGNPACELQQTAFRLLQVLDRRFFGGLPPFHIHHHSGQEMKEDLHKQHFTLDAMLGKMPYSMGQTFLSRQLSLLHPELTMPMFSEISWRMKSARSDVRQSLLRYLQPWLHNMELVEPPIPSPNVIAPLRSLTKSTSGQLATSRSCSLCGRKYYDDSERSVRRGWGSTEATEMVLNNLLYLTAKFGDEHEREIEECWQTLCCLSPTNQRVILYYLLIVTGLAPNEVLPHAKRVLIYLFRAQPLKLLEDLMAELQTVESLSWLVERTETPPFYRLSHLRKTSSYSDNNPSATNGCGGWNSNTFQSSNSSAPANFLRINASELEKGTIHTKRRSAEESTVFQQQPQPHLRSSSSGTTNLFRTEKARTISGPAALPDTQFLASEKERARSALYESECTPNRYDIESGDLEDQNQYPSSETLAAGAGGMTSVTGRSNSAGRDDTLLEHELQSKLVPLPMPEYGGYYAALKEFFPAQPVVPFHRCNMALMFISELITEGTTISFPVDDPRKEIKIEWCSEYLPIMIHMAFLGLDHLRPLVHQHGYRFLINILTVAGHHKNHLAVAKLLLNQQTKDLNIGLAVPALGLCSVDFLAIDLDLESAGISCKYSDVDTIAVGGISPNARSPSHSPKSGSPRTPSKRNHSPANLMLIIPDAQDYSNLRKPLTIQDLTVSLIQFLAEHERQPLWACEDITARLWNIKSANQLFAFLKNTLKVFSNSFPGSKLESRWAQVSLQIGLACSSRHYAGRSLQAYRALKVPLIQRTLCDILSRLVETVAEQGDDMQGYVTELILTLETCVEAIPVEQPDSDDVWNTNDENYYNEDDDGLDCETVCKVPSTGREGSSTGDLSPVPQMRARSGTDSFGQECKRPADLSRSRSAHSLGGLQSEGGSGDQDSLERNLGRESRTEVIPQVFWLSLSLLESDYEHEYLLALGLLEKVMERLPLDRLDCRDKIDRIQSQLQWSSFSGVVPLLLKGITNPNTYEQSLSVLCRFIPFLDMSFVDPTGETGFPLTVIAFMPYLLSSYDEPSNICLEAAHLIAEVAAEKLDCGSQPLQHLATVMTLYSRRSFSKEAFQWNKCVIKYLYDSYGHLAPLLLGCLLDVLEKGPASIQSACLTILHCSFSYVDFTTAGIVSPELLRAIQKHLEGPQWRESLRILKLVVTRSSYLVAPAPQPPSSYSGNSGPPSMAWDSVSTSSSAFSTDTELSFKKELPGRTMEFTFDVSQTPVIGRRHPSTSNAKEEPTTSRLNIGGLHQRSGSIGEMGINTGSSGIIQSAWKRPWQCQSRVRECLVSVLNACGQRVGLPKSPSVIFSQSSELLERQSSVASSTEEVSVAINDGSGASRFEEGSASDAHFRVFRDFDFLEYELESVDGESSDNFNWGVRRRPLSELGTEPETEGETDSDILGSKVSNVHSSTSQSSIEQNTIVPQSPSNIRRPSEMGMDIGAGYIHIHHTEESSDEEDLGLSPLDEVIPQLQGIISSDPPTPQPHSLTMLEIASSSQISSPARSRRLSDTSIDSRSEDENTPSNTSPHGEPHIEDGDGEPLLHDTEAEASHFPAEAEDTDVVVEEDGDQDDSVVGAAGIDFEFRNTEDVQDKPSLYLLYGDPQ